MRRAIVRPMLFNERATKILLLISLCLVLWLTNGCATVRLNNSHRLIARPDFPVAARAAPEWVRDALKTINALEYELERK